MHRPRREYWKFMLCCIGAVSLALLGGCAQSRGHYEGGPQAQNFDDGQEAFPPVMEGGPRPVIAPVQPARVNFSNAEPPGTILIDTARRKLYLTLNANEAYDYPISVGREGFTWTGTEKISRIADWPDWYPPKEMLERDPKLPTKMLGGLRNPLGAKALFLGNTLYRIHGTNDPTVPYAGSSTMMPIDTIVKYWVTKNNCNVTPTFSNVPNTSTTDGCTAEHYKYLNGTSGSSVELYKIIGENV